PMYNDQSRLRALLQATIERLCQRYKLTLSLAICLCLGFPAHAKYVSPVLTAPILNTDLANSSTTSAAKARNTDILVQTANEIASLPSSTEQSQLAVNSADANNQATFSPAQSELGEPSLYALLDAEFAADRDDNKRALTIYKQQSFKQDATAVFERALSLSLRTESVEDSLRFAKTWQDQNPDHVPAWFYVAHLALRAHDYELAGATLNRILNYDPRADLSEILIGIYPNT